MRNQNIQLLPLTLHMDLEISVKSYRCMLRIQAARASHARARNMIFHKGLKKVFIQLLNPIKNMFY